MTPLVQAKLRNQTLSQLPPNEFQAIAQHLQSIDLPPRATLIPNGSHIDTVYFIESGLVSVLGVLENGGRVEISHVGNEGLIGVQVLLGAETALFETVVQVKGQALKISAPLLVKLLSQSKPLQVGLLQYAWRAHVQIAQTAVCNAAHEVEQRLARWLLMAHDRLEGDNLPLTQEVLSTMLGVSRPAVNLASGALQRAGLIKTLRGAVRVLDRKGLEAAACECYRASLFLQKTR